MIITQRAAPAINQYANNNNYSLDTGVHPIVSVPSDLTGKGVILTIGQSLMAQYGNYVPPTPSNVSKLFQFHYPDGTLRSWVEPIFGPGPKTTLSGFIHSDHVLDGLSSTAGVLLGSNVQGFGLMANTTVVYVGDTFVFISPNAVVTTGPSNYDFATLVGSWFGQLGDNLISDGTFPNGVIFCNTAIGGTLSSDWAPSGQYHSIITTALKRLRSVNLPPTAVIIGQGETETFYGIDGSWWLANWRETVKAIRSFYPTVPIFFAKESHNIGVTNASVQAAQLQIAQDDYNHAGPDSDARGDEYRYDTTHWGINSNTGFNGGTTTARDWADVLGAVF